MASYGSDYHKLSALNALEVLALNNAAAREQLVAQGTDKMLEGLATMGSSLLRSEAASFAAGLKSPLDQVTLGVGAGVGVGLRVRGRGRASRPGAAHRARAYPYP